VECGIGLVFASPGMNVANGSGVELGSSGVRSSGSGKVAAWARALWPDAVWAAVWQMARLLARAALSGGCDPPGLRGYDLRFPGLMQFAPGSERDAHQHGRLPAGLGKACRRLRHDRPDLGGRDFTDVENH